MNSIEALIKEIIKKYNLTAEQSKIILDKYKVFHLEEPVPKS